MCVAVGCVGVSGEKVRELLISSIQPDHHRFPLFLSSSSLFLPLLSSTSLLLPLLHHYSTPPEMDEQVFYDEIKSLKYFSSSHLIHLTHSHSQTFCYILSLPALYILLPFTFTYLSILVRDHKTFMSSSLRLETRPGSGFDDDEDEYDHDELCSVHASISLDGKKSKPCTHSTTTKSCIKKRFLNSSPARSR